MNASNAKEFIPIVQALADGKQIQWQNERDEWVDLGKGQNLAMDLPASCYRVKKEPRAIYVNDYGTWFGRAYATEQEAVNNRSGIASTVKFIEAI